MTDLVIAIEEGLAGTKIRISIRWQSRQVKPGKLQFWKNLPLQVSM